MNTRLLLAAASAAAVTVLNAHAVQFEYGDYPLEGEVGTGASTSICVFDFGAATPNQYAFGYLYDGVKTGSDMLQALNSAGIPGLSINLVVDAVFGDYVVDISYASHSIVSSPSFFDDPYLYPNYWIGAGGETGPTSWTSAAYGISARTLTDGSWDGFTQAKFFSNGDFEAFAPSGAFAAVVPEPAALSLLALGAGLMATRARPRRKARGQRR